MKKESNNLFKKIYNYLSGTKLHYYLHKTVSPKNTYLVALVVISLFILISYFSYAMFTVYEQRQRVLTMQAGTLSLNITSPSFDNNKSISLTGKEMNIIDVDVINNSMTKVKIDLNYVTNNNAVQVYYIAESSNADGPSGDDGQFNINANKTAKVELVIYNNSDTSANVTFSSDIGLPNADLTGENTVITQAIYNPYEAMGLNSNTLAYKIYDNNLSFMGLTGDMSAEPLYSVSYILDSDNEYYGLLHRYTDTSGSFTYVYRGIDIDNYVEFAGTTWRILRIQADGTVKLIKEDFLNFESDKVDYDEDEFKLVAYNSEDLGDNSSYDGSNIKSYVEEWYNAEMMSYDSKIVTNKYCSDRTEDENSLMYQVYHIQKVYGIGNRLSCVDCDGESDPRYDEGEYIFKPSVSCRAEDEVSAKVALITADEYVLAGGSINDTNNFLVKGYPWWTMSPFGIYHGSARVNLIDFSGSYADDAVNLGWAVRPVITLKANTTVASGDGKHDTPYVIN